MDAQLARRIAPIGYGIAVVVAALWLSSAALTGVAVVGAMLLGLLYVATSPRGGRQRDRARNRT